MRFSKGQQTLFYAGSTSAVLLIFLFYVYYISSLDASSTIASPENIAPNGKEQDWFKSSPETFGLQLNYSQTNQAIVPRIWQMGKAPFLSTWQTLNPGYRFELLIDSAADSIVEEISREHLPSLSQIYADITTPILKWDFLRYLLLWQYGGYYADTDATPLTPIESWVPPDYDKGSISALVGLEVDEPDLTDPGKIEEMRFTSNLQFCQWMLVSRPKHEILKNVISSIMTDVTAFNDVAPTRMEILQTTGPGAYTRAVKKYLQDRVPDFDISKLFLIQEPMQVADILFLPQHSFAYYGSYSSRPKNTDTERLALIYHSLAGSWKTAENEPTFIPSDEAETEEERPEDPPNSEQLSSHDDMVTSGEISDLRVPVGRPKGPGAHNDQVRPSAVN